MLITRTLSTLSFVRIWFWYIIDFHNPEIRPILVHKYDIWKRTVNWFYLKAKTPVVELDDHVKVTKFTLVNTRRMSRSYIWQDIVSFLKAFSKSQSFIEIATKYKLYEIAESIERSVVMISLFWFGRTTHTPLGRIANKKIYKLNIINKRLIKLNIADLYYLKNKKRIQMAWNKKFGDVVIHVLNNRYNSLVRLNHLPDPPFWP